MTPSFMSHETHTCANIESKLKIFKKAIIYLSKPWNHQIMKRKMSALRNKQTFNGMQALYGKPSGPTCDTDV